MCCASRFFLVFFKIIGKCGVLSGAFLDPRTCTLSGLRPRASRYTLHEAIPLLYHASASSTVPHPYTNPAPTNFRNGTAAGRGWY